MGAGVMIAITAVLVMMSKYKHRAIIKDITNRTKIVKSDKFRVKKHRDGTIWYKLLKAKKELPPPPSECIEVSEKGRMFIQWYRLDEHNFIPGSDEWDWKANKDEVVKSIQPYTTSERSLMVNQHLKAERDKKKSIGEMLMTAAPYLAIVLILVLFMIFFNDAVAPMKEVGAAYERVSENLVDATSRLDMIINQRQELIAGDNIIINRTAPTE